MQSDLAGDVKKLTGGEKKYRLRVGKHRILFRLEVDTIVVYDVKDRKELMSKIVSPESATLKNIVEELNRLRERVEDLEDLRDLNMAIERNAGKKRVAWEEICREFGWDFETLKKERKKSKKL